MELVILAVIVAAGYWSWHTQTPAKVWDWINSKTSG